MRKSALAMAGFKKGDVIVLTRATGRPVRLRVIGVVPKPRKPRKSPK